MGIIRLNHDEDDWFDVPVEELPKEKLVPFPDPKQFEIIDTQEIGGGDLQYLVAVVRYPQCPDYEGRKVLVYKGIKAEYFRRWKEIDPHFNTNQPRKTPMARFRPTNEGLAMALSFCHWQIAMHVSREIDYIQLAANLPQEMFDFLHHAAGFEKKVRR
jgi:hypothetical protein